MKYTDKNQLIRDWYAALKSGKYKQGHKTMRKDDVFCCLGVITDIAEIEPKYKTGAYPWDAGIVASLIDYNPYLRIPSFLKHRVSDFESRPAAVLNDDYRFTFDEIADCIRATWPEAFASEPKENLASLMRELGTDDSQCCGPNGCSA